jgi:hypothetical protein
VSAAAVDDGQQLYGFEVAGTGELGFSTKLVDPSNVCEVYQYVGIGLSETDQHQLQSSSQ